LGNILLLQGDQEGGREYYEQFLNISKEIGDRWGEGRVIRNIADVYLDQADFRDARNYFEKALQITREIGNRTIESSALVGLGNVYLEQSDYARAKANFEQSLEIAREIGNRPWEAKTLSQIGRFFHRQGDYLRARSYYEQSLQIYQELGNQIGQAQVLVDVGLLDHHLGDDEGSLEVSLQALRIAEMLNHPKNQGLALNQLGRSYEGLGKTSEAISFYQKSYDLFVKLDQRNLAMEALAGLARLSLAEGEKLKALDQVGEILKYLETVSNSPGLSDEMGMGASSDPQNRIMQGLEGASDPMTVYLTCYQVLKAAGDGRARELLAEMYRAIQEQASNIEDIDLHHSFLQNIAANKEIQSEVELSGLGMDVFQNTSNS
jgi:tetratricopeptide (TPR) repeat protein